MLDEYFSLSIDTNVETVKSLPMLLPGWAPDLDKLPLCGLLSLARPKQG